MGEAAWECLCKCGNIRILRGSEISSGLYISCGCYRRELIGKRSVTHGMSCTPTYISWCSMKNRCLNPKYPSYPEYGGSGIKMCARWDLFENFLADLGVRPKGTTLDRIRNQEGYFPGNCKWSTLSEQCRNRKSTVFLKIGSETKCQSEWAENYGINPRCLQSRIASGKIKAERVKAPSPEHVC